MSNRNHNVIPANGNTNGVNAPANGGEQVKEKKPGFIGKLKHARDKVMANKIGKGVVRVLKFAGVTGIGFACYKAGAKSVKPTTVYIREGVTEEPAPTENEQE